MNSGIPTSTGDYEPEGSWGGSTGQGPASPHGAGSEMFSGLRAQLENIASRLDGLAAQDAPRDREPPPLRPGYGGHEAPFRDGYGRHHEDRGQAGWPGASRDPASDARLEHLTQSVHQIAERLGMSEQRNADTLRQISHRLEHLASRGEAQAMAQDRSGYDHALNRIEQRVAELGERMARPTGQESYDARALDRRIDSLAQAVQQLSAGHQSPPGRSERPEQAPWKRWPSGPDAPADVFADPGLRPEPPQPRYAPPPPPQPRYAPPMQESGWRQPSAPFAPWPSGGTSSPAGYPQQHAPAGPPMPAPGWHPPQAYPPAWGNAAAQPAPQEPSPGYGMSRQDRDALGQAVGDLIKRMESAERALGETARSAQSGNEDLGRRLDEIGGLIQDTQSRIGGLEHLEETFDHLMARIDAAVQQADHGEQIDSLLHQLDEIRATIFQTAEAAVSSQDAARMAAEEAARMAAHETLLSAQDAARAAVLEAIHALPAPHTDADHDLVQALQQNLYDLRGEMDTSEQRTQATLLAVNETMNAVAQRLAELDSEQPASGGVAYAPAHETPAYGPEQIANHAGPSAEQYYEPAEPPAPEPEPEPGPETDPGMQPAADVPAIETAPMTAEAEPAPAMQPEPIHPGYQQMPAPQADDPDMRAYLDQGYGSEQSEPAYAEPAPATQTSEPRFMSSDHDTGYGPSPQSGAGQMQGPPSRAVGGGAPSGGYQPADNPELNRPREPGSGPPALTPEPAPVAAGAGPLPPHGHPSTPLSGRQEAPAPGGQQGHAAPPAGAGLREASTNEQLRLAARRAAQAAASQQSMQTAGQAPKKSIMGKLLGGLMFLGAAAGNQQGEQMPPRREPRLAGGPPPAQPPAQPAQRRSGPPPGGGGAGSGGSKGRTLVRSMALAAAAVLLVAGSVRIYSMMAPGAAPEDSDAAPAKMASAKPGMEAPGARAGGAGQTMASGESSGDTGMDPPGDTEGPGTQTIASAPLGSPEDASGGSEKDANAARPADMAGEITAKPAAEEQDSQAARFDLPDAAVGPASLRQAAAGGDPVAQFEVASRYAEGRGVERDLKLAAKWYRNAASLGLAPAQYRIGSMYEKGKGVSKDRETARIWYERAANAGNRTAMHNLAVLHADGVDGKPDFDQAAKWFRMASDLDLNDSQYNLAILYVRGMGVPQSFAEAYKWFAILAAKGDKDAASRLDVLAEKLDENALAAAKLAAQTWKPEPLDAQANAVRLPPGGWNDKSSSADIAPPGADIVRAAQKLLAGQGFEPGPADGAWGPQTQAALKAFERQAGLDATGVLTPALLRRLQQGAVASGPSV